MEIEGMIIRDLGQTEGVSKVGNPWKKHEYVMEVPGQFTRRVKFHVFGERCNTLVFEVGKSYAISVDIESREFNERWYTDVSAYAARPLEGTTPGPAPTDSISQVQGPVFQQQSVAPAPPKVEVKVDFEGGGAQDDLPF